MPHEHLAHTDQRRERLKAKLRELDLPALLVTLPANRFYLSGFELHDPQCNESAGALLVCVSGDDWLLTDSRYEEAAKRLWPADRVHIYSSPRHADIRGFVQGLGFTRIGFEAAAMSFADHHELAKSLELVPTQGLVEELRVIKDEAEIKAMRRSLALNHAVFSEVPSLLVPGKSEAELAWELEQRFKSRGATELSFSTIVGVGPNAALPHAVPGPDAIRENELVLVDMGCRVDDYCSDQTRTFWVGDEPVDRFNRIKQHVLEAQEAAIAMLRPGVTGAEAYHAARGVFERLGVAEAFTHSLGHGIGLETHEQPSLSPTSTRALAPGMIVTVEPGLYYPDWGGFRWEYMVRITEDGCEVL